MVLTWCSVHSRGTVGLGGFCLVNKSANESRYSGVDQTLLKHRDYISVCDKCPHTQLCYTMGLWRGYCHSSWKASLLPTFHISWSEWASALDGCDQPPGPRTPCAHTPPRGAVPPGQSLERTTHPSRAPGRCCGGRSRPGWCGWTSPGSIAVPPWIHPGSGIGSRAFGRSSQSHCELRNGPCYSDIQLEFQECEVGSLARFGERRNCHLWGRPREITDVYNWNTKKKKKARLHIQRMDKNM